jgi:hypothetical protein
LLEGSLDQIVKTLVDELKGGVVRWQ